MSEVCRIPLPPDKMGRIATICDALPEEPGLRCPPPGNSLCVHTALRSSQVTRLSLLSFTALMWKMALPQVGARWTLRPALPPGWCFTPRSLGTANAESPSSTDPIATMTCRQKRCHGTHPFQASSKWTPSCSPLGFSLASHLILNPTVAAAATVADPGKGEKTERATCRLLTGVLRHAKKTNSNPHTHSVRFTSVIWKLSLGLFPERNHLWDEKPNTFRKPHLAMWAYEALGQNKNGGRLSAFSLSVAFAQGHLAKLSSSHMPVGFLWDFTIIPTRCLAPWWDTEQPKHRQYLCLAETNCR